MITKERYTVSQVASMAHVTVRALHYYDQIGLLTPSERGENGYRLYGAEDLARLREILLFRQLEFPLEAIGPLLEAPVYERRRALEAQRELLKEQRGRLNAIIRGVGVALAALEGDVPMDGEKMFEGFEDFDPAQYEDEARERWGETDSYRESMRRTRQYRKEDWARIKEEADEVMARMADLLAAGEPPDGNAAMDLAEEHRKHIDRWFYPCSHEMHWGLSEMYTGDPRFARTFEKRATGLAAYVQAAIQANAVR